MQTTLRIDGFLCAEQAAAFVAGNKGAPTALVPRQVKSFRGGSRGPETGVRGIPSPFIDLDERGRDTPHPSLLPLLPPRKDLFAGLLQWRVGAADGLI